MTVIPFEEVPQTRRWWARAAFAAVLCAAAVPLVAAGVAGTVALLLTGAGGVVVTVALIPSPLGIGTLKLDDGSSVQGFVCEPAALDGAIDISHLGGWRNYLQTLVVPA